MAAQIQSGLIYHGINYFGVTDLDWTLLGAIGPRQFKKTVTFPSAFTGVSPVTVQLSVASVFQLSTTGLRLDVQPLNVTKTTFDLQISTWDDCLLMGVGVAWTAVQLS